MRKDFDIFSKDELAMLKNFANKAIIEDKKIHVIQGNNNINNKQNQFISKKEEKKHLLQQNQVKKPEPSKMVNTKLPELKKKKKQ